MKILVIGSEGVLGQPLVRELRKRGHQVYRCDIQKSQGDDFILADIRRYDTLQTAFDIALPDAVFHLAGEVSRLTCEAMQTAAFDTNVTGMVNVAKLCQQYDARVVYASSSEVYGSNYLINEVVDETMPCQGQLGVYGLTKWMGEEILEYWHRRYNLRICIMRIIMNYGPGEYPYFYRSAIAQFIDAARRGRPLIVHKNTERSWCYVDDTIGGLIAALGYSRGHGVFNIGRDEPIATYNLAKLICQLTESNSEIQLIEPEHVIPVKRNSYDKIKNILGWESKVPLREGLERTITWHQDNVRL